MPAFYHDIATRMGNTLDDDMISAIEGACVTESEWMADREACVARIRGAMEEMGEDFS